MQARSEGNIVVDGLCEWVWFLKDHAHAAAQFHHIERPAEQVIAVQGQGAAGARARNGVVHPVYPAEKGALAAARWADQRGHAALGNFQ